MRTHHGKRGHETGIQREGLRQDFESRKNRGRSRRRRRSRTQTSVRSRAVPDARSQSLVMREEYMKLNRRIFLSALLFVKPRRIVSLEVEVLETFGLDERSEAILVHHSDPKSREQFAKWLQ